MDDDDLRRRLGQIGDELAGLEPHDLPARHELHREADELRRRLRAAADHESGDDEATLRRWAERSPRRTGETSDDDLDRARAGLVSPGEGGDGVG